MKSGNLDFLEPSGPVQASIGFVLPFFTHNEQFNSLEAKNVTCKSLALFITRGIKSSLLFLAFVLITSCCGKVKAMDRTVVAKCLDIQSSSHHLPH